MTIDLPPGKRFAVGLLLSIFLAMSFVSYNLPYTFLPVYNKARDISSSWTGTILGATALAAIISNTFMAPLMLQKYSIRIILLASGCGLGGSLLLQSGVYLLTNDGVFKVAAIVLRFSSGIFIGFMECAAFAGVVMLYPKKVATANALGEAVLNSALASGPFLGAVLYEAGGFKLPFLVCGGVIFIASFAAFLIPVELGSTDNAAPGETVDPDNVPPAGIKSLSLLLSPWILFPLWHLASAQILLTYHMPLISLHAEEMFSEDVVWSGGVILIGTGVICLSSPILGVLIDKYSPYVIMLLSCFTLPLSYIFVGPLPILSIAPSKLQLILSMSVLGICVPMACITQLPIVLEVYQLINKKLPRWVINVLVSENCSSYHIGIFLGSSISGFIPASFGWSTGALGLIYILQSIAGVGYCYKVWQLKKSARSEENVVYQNTTAE